MNPADRKMYVIGSGPAGVSAAVPLVERGYSVTMLDVGLELEPERKKMVATMARQGRDEWDEGSLEAIRHSVSVSNSGLSFKYIYGSDYPYRESLKVTPLTTHGVQTHPSSARGGFSTVWGATVLPYFTRDISDWPFSIDALKPHYEAVLSFMNFAAKTDDLEKLYPLYTNSREGLNSSRQAEFFLKDLNQFGRQLNSEGVFVGQSRLAVRAGMKDGMSGCVYCGLCMYGCPYNLIYSASSTLEFLLQYPNFKYAPNVIAEKIDPSNGSVKIKCRSRFTGEPLRFEGERVFLAAGPFASTKIILESLEAYDQPVMMRDSRYFLFPLIRYQKVSGVTEENLHTLSQIFMELRDQTLCPETIHLQLYSYNDFYLEAVKKILRFPAKLAKALMGEILGRLFVIQGYLHSNQSPTIKVTLRREKGDRAVSHLELIAESQQKGKSIIHGVVKKLLRNRSYLKAIPFPLFLQTTKPGRGFHSGGTFPMRTRPSRLESDIFGCLSDLPNVHVVDASIFPSIPATTITFSVMANAHRIASTFN